MAAELALDNPMWAEILRGIAAGLFRLDEGTLSAPLGPVQLNAVAVKYSQTISDPDTLTSVHTAIGEGSPVVVVDAHNGYWPYLLRQLGHRVTAYANHPVRPAWGNERVTHLSQRKRQIQDHADDVLVFMHIKDRQSMDAAANVILQYPGDRLVIVADKPHKDPVLRRALAGWEYEAGRPNGVVREKQPKQVWAYRRPTEPRPAWASLPTAQLLRVG